MFLFCHPELPFYKLTFLATSSPAIKLSDFMQNLQLPLSRASDARSVCDITSVDKDWPSCGHVYLWQL